MRVTIKALIIIVVGSYGLLFAGMAAAQTDPASPRTVPADERSQAQPSTPKRSDAIQLGNAGSGTDVPPEFRANRLDQNEETAVVSYYNNFFSTYRLGPEDVISVTVFNQDRYSRGGIVVPPSGRISLQLIPGGIFVNGKTVDEVAGLITKKYDEYIIDPQVTVSLDKAASYRYSVIGDVGQPGVRVMNHRLTVTEALAEAGGVLPTGNRSGVLVLRRQQNGSMASIPVNVSAVYKGKVPDTVYLVPGDQVIVPGNKLKTLQKIMSLTSIVTFARVFAGY